MNVQANAPRGVSEHNSGQGLLGPSSRQLTGNQRGVESPVGQGDGDATHGVGFLSSCAISGHDSPQPSLPA